MNVTGERDHLESLHARARVAARHSGRRVLLCWSTRIPSLDPLAWLEGVAAASGDDPDLQSLMREGSMHWAHPAGRFAFSGAGAAVTVASEGEDRFESADRAWLELLHDAVVSENSDGVTGPVLAGGFAFDPDGASAPEWKGFGSCRLVLPRLRITAAGDDCWVTVSTLVGKQDDARSSLDSLWRLYSLACTPPRSGPAQQPRNRATELTYSSERPESAWQMLVADAVGEIQRGRFEKVVLARAMRALARNDIDAFALLGQLREGHRKAFVFAFWGDSAIFVGASPERLVGLHGERVSASSLAGTARRDADPLVDEARAASLLASTKDQREHALVRDTITRSLAEVCDDVSVTGEPVVLSLPQIHHLHTEVRGTLRPGHSLLDLVGRLHPTPAVGGSPSRAALTFIREREELDRGWYAGPVGWVGASGGEFAVGLRSGLICGSSAVLFAGCGIVAASEPRLELEESALKLRVLASAIEASLGAEVSPGAESRMAGCP